MKRAIALVLVLGLSGCGAKPTDEAAEVGNVSPTATSTGEQTSSGDAVADPAVKLDIVDYLGVMERIAGNRGKVVVMDAWSTACPPCMKEFHNLVELHNEHGPEKVACISLSFDYEGIDSPEDQVPRVRQFLESQDATFDNLLSSEESDVLYRKFDLAAVPAVFVYDQAGKLRKRFDNEQAKTPEETFTYEQVKALVKELLAEQPADAEASESPVEAETPDDAKNPEPTGDDGDQAAPSE